MKHTIFQENKSKTELIEEIEAIIANIENNHESKATVRATELLFGCPMIKIPTEDNDLWKLYNHLWEGCDPKLIVTISKNHYWAKSRSNNKSDLSFEIYPGEFFIITGEGVEETLNFIDQIITVGE